MGNLSSIIRTQSMDSGFWGRVCFVEVYFDSNVDWLHWTVASNELLRYGYTVTVRASCPLLIWCYFLMNIVITNLGWGFSLVSLVHLASTVASGAQKHPQAQHFQLDCPDYQSKSPDPPAGDVDPHWWRHTDTLPCRQDRGRCFHKRLHIMHTRSRTLLRHFHILVYSASCSRYDNVDLTSHGRGL